MIPKLKTLHIKTSKTARCQILEPRETDKISECWIVIHGYAQLAANFIKDFEPFQKAGRIIVAPEGLNRFYAKGFSGNPAATWMTSEDRENEIEDYCNYLQKLQDTLKENYALKGDCKFLLLGFSQGVATLSRWVNNKNPDFDTLVFYAGSIAHDLDWEKFVAQTKGKDFHFISGDADPMITTKALQEALDFYREKGLEFETHFFNGGHEIKAEALRILV